MLINSLEMDQLTIKIQNYTRFLFKKIDVLARRQFFRTEENILKQKKMSHPLLADDSLS